MRTRDGSLARRQIRRLEWSPLRFAWMDPRVRGLVAKCGASRFGECPAADGPRAPARGTRTEGRRLAAITVSNLLQLLVIDSQ
jgi:hypothetical protein